MGNLKKYLFLIISVIANIALICFAVLLIPGSPVLSSGLVAIISAFLGVIITIAVTRILLEQQSETESKKDKDIRLYKEKIAVFSKFTEKMWNMLDDEKITIQELKELRKECFNKLVFYLNEKQTKKMAEFINEISYEDVTDDNSEEKDTTNPRSVFANITHLLQGILKEEKEEKKEKKDENEKKGSLLLLYNSFNKEKPESTSESSKETDSEYPSEELNQSTLRIDRNITYWHFNILREKEQIEAFKTQNWVLSLIEYGEKWRTNLLEQVRSDDVIFLFKRGGDGYIGAFRALSPSAEILTVEKYEKKEYTAEHIETFDIYGGFDDGATLCSNILVEPIAYNYKGIGYYTVRRRTIERMNDMEAVKYLLTRFDGKELGEDRKIGAGKFDDKTPVTGINSDYFNKVLKENKI